MDHAKHGPLGEHDIVVHVEKGMASHVKVVEAERNALPNEITVHISKKRKTAAVPVLGVVVK